MNAKRTIEIFSAGCPVCEAAVARVQRLACPSCDVAVLDMKASAVAERAAQLGVRSLPAVVVGGELAACCQGRGVDEGALEAAGLGRSVA